MTRYLLKKLITLLILLFLVSIAVFSVLFVLPGDPAQIILGINATPETLANLRAELGLIPIGSAISSPAGGTAPSIMTCRSLN
jgi:ABC-type dipeptide/oligopeptide/nickel transport system permease component